MARSYADAVAALNTLQSNFVVVDAIRKSNNGMNKAAIPEMIEWCRRMGYEPSEFNDLNLIHIAGTKGKGSTSAFISSILGQYLPSSEQKTPLFKKTGLYTSPHLRFVRERIQINNEPISEEAFAKYFFEVWDRLEDTARAKGQPIDVTAKPSYFRFLTLMAFHTYKREGVDSAVIECGIGGEYDSTNIIKKPVVTGITSLGIDHTAVLGNTIEEIAWHKAGIMKPSIPAYTAPQPNTALDVLKRRAQEARTSIELVERNQALSDIKLGLAADFQVTNASLAVAIAQRYLTSLGHLDPTNSFLPPEFTRGLERVRWPGRCETRYEKNLTWCIDSGHTLESIELAASWFATQIPPSSTTSSSPSRKPSPTRILLFNQQTRDANALAVALHRTLEASIHDSRPFTHAVFCTNVTFKEEGFKPDLVSMNTSAQAVERLEVQKRLAETWKGIDGATEVVVKGSIEEATAWCRDIAKGVDGETMALVTGSVHLVGGFLEVLESGKGM